MKHLIISLALALTSLLTYSQCRDTIIEKFGTGLPTQGGTWQSNSIQFGNSTTCPGTSCSYSPEYYLGLNGLGDFIRTPLIPNPSVFSFWYRRSNTTPNAHRAVVETSPDGTTWTTQLTITTFTATFTKVTLSVNNVFVRIRDIRTVSTDTKLWYIDDVAWSWENRVGVWTGTFSDDWNDSRNWCKGQVPSLVDNVIIPNGTPFNCVIQTSQTGECNNIIIASSNSLKINGKLRLAGQITSSQNLDMTSGTLEMAGTTSQTLTASSIIQNLLNDLVISNSDGVVLNGANDTLKLKNSLTFNTSNSTLITNGNLTLLSSDTLTARIGDLTNNNISGNVTVERFIPNHPKAWQLMAVPTKGQTFNSSWQEGNVPLGNSRPGRGTILTGSFIGVDISSGLPSVKSYNSTTNGWDGITSTSSLVNTNKGYMLFVRGDRSVTTISQAPTTTILRTTGTLYQPSSPPPTINIDAEKYECINNFYASPIDFSKLTRTGGVQNTFYIWDPKLTSNTVSAYGLGGYQTFVWNGTNYVAIPGGGSYTNGNTNIESGNAFFVKSFGSSGSISFNETAKTTGSNLVTRPVVQPSVRTYLYSPNQTTPILLDGTLTYFNNQYSNNVDLNDVRKIGSEGISMSRNNIGLTAEFRTDILTRDTIFYNFTSLRRQSYILSIKLENFDNYSVKVIDNHLRTTTFIPVDGTELQFTVDNNITSYKNRFNLIIEKIKLVTPPIYYETNIKISPNPFVNEFFIESENLQIGKYEFLIFDIFGKLRYQGVCYYSKSPIKITNINLSKGVYKLVLKNKTTIVGVNLLVN
jgi:hypothetical protein